MDDDDAKSFISRASKWKQTGHVFDDALSCDSSSSTKTVRSLNFMPDESYNNQREILVTFCGSAYVCREEDRAIRTVVHINDFLRYKISKEGWAKWTWSKAKRYFREKTQQLNVNFRGYPMKTFGPVQIPIEVDGCSFNVIAGVTYDARLMHRMLIGADTELLSCVGSEIIEVDDKPQLTMNLDGTREIEMCMDRFSLFKNVLVDTGAGPSVMSYQTFHELRSMHELHGGEASDLELKDVKVPLKAANGSKIHVVGRTPILSLKLGDIDIAMSFVVCRGVRREVILGRDFLFAYDALVDLPRGKSP